MNKLLYKLAGWILIIAGIIYALANLYFSSGGPTLVSKIGEFGLGLLGSALIFIFSFFPGKYYLKLGDNEDKHNKLTNWSLALTLVGMVLVVIAFVAMLIICPFPSVCDGWGVMLIFWGIIPAAFLYVISVILLIINKFKE